MTLNEVLENISVLIALTAFTRFYLLLLLLLVFTYPYCSYSLLPALTTFTPQPIPTHTDPVSPEKSHYTYK